MTATAIPVRRQLHPPEIAASPFPYNAGSLLSVDDLTLDAISHLLTRATVLEIEDPLAARASALAQAARGAAVL